MRKIIFWMSILLLMLIAGIGMSSQKYKWTKTELDTIISKLENKEDCIIYFGYADCPWCIEAEPILKQAAQKAGVEILYGETRTETTAISHEQIEKIKPYLEGYEEYIDKNGNFHFYVPTVLIQENGEITDHHMGTVGNHNPHEEKMTEAQQQELLEIYGKMFRGKRLFSWI